MMKRIFVFVLPLILLASICFGVNSASANIEDLAGLLTDTQKSELDRQIEAVENLYQTDILIITRNSINGEDAESWANDYYDRNHCGVGEDNSGILLLLSMDDRQWAVITVGEAHSVVTNRNIDSIMDEVLPCLSADDYMEAFELFIRLVEEEYEYYDPTEGQLSSTEIIVISAVIGLIGAGIAILIMRGSMKTARNQRTATSYMVPSSYQLTQRADFYLYSRTTRTAKPKNNGSSGGGGSRGGRSGRF